MESHLKLPVEFVIKGELNFQIENTEPELTDSSNLHENDTEVTYLFEGTLDLEATQEVFEAFRHAKIVILSFYLFLIYFLFISYLFLLAYIILLHNNLKTRTLLLKYRNIEKIGLQTLLN